MSQLLGLWVWQCVEDGFVDLGVTRRRELARLPFVFLLQAELDVLAAVRIELNFLPLDERLAFDIATGLVVDLRDKLFLDRPRRKQLVQLVLQRGALLRQARV